MHGYDGRVTEREGKWASEGCRFVPRVYTGSELGSSGKCFKSRGTDRVTRTDCVIDLEGAGVDSGENGRRLVQVGEAVGLLALWAGGVQPGWRLRGFFYHWWPVG